MGLCHSIITVLRCMQYVSTFLPTWVAELVEAVELELGYISIIKNRVTACAPLEEPATSSAWAV